MNVGDEIEQVVGRYFRLDYCCCLFLLVVK